MRVLVVEDERPLARALKRGLDAEGLLTDLEHDGRAGADAALSGDYDAIVLDIMLPRLNGYDVCKELRAAGVWTPVLMLSAKDGDYDQVDAFDLGADDDLVKPFSSPCWWRGSARSSAAAASTAHPCDEIARLAATMNDMLDRLEHSSVAQRRFVADASHELRSPIATIRTLQETAALSPHPDGPEGLAREVLAETTRLEHLVADLLLLARSDAAAGLPHELVDLTPLVAEEANRSRSLPVMLDADTPVRVTGDAGALARLVRNLLDNAERHARSRIEVAVTPHGDRVDVAVSDDGPGVAPADRERIFERFVRLDDARARDDGGSGLGLSIARQTAVEHGGTLVLVDRPNGGSRFVLSLPAHA